MLYIHMYLKIQASEYGQAVHYGSVNKKLVKHYGCCHMDKNVYTVCNADALDFYATGQFLNPMHCLKPTVCRVLSIWYNSFFYKKFYTASCSYGLLSMFLYRTGCCIAAQKKAYLYACLSFQNNPVYPYTATKQNTEINEFFKKNNTI